MMKMFVLFVTLSSMIVAFPCRADDIHPIEDNAPLRRRVEDLPSMRT